MDVRSLESGPICDAVALQGGTQNILVRFRRGEREFVLRRPPLHPYVNGNETMLREARTLAALAGTPVPHPALIAACSDESVLGAAFYLMAPVDGFNATVEMPPLHSGGAAIRQQMGLAMADAAVELARVDFKSAGLALRGEPEGYLQRQIERWGAQLESYVQYAGWPGPSSIPELEIVSRWLEAHCPATFTPGIIHGDFHLANVLYDRHSARLAAIVDWELSTVGDPLLDLGWLIATWPDEDGSGGTSSVTPWQGFPTIDAVIARYRQLSDRDLSSVEWYGVFACYKLGILLEGTQARACAGKAQQETGDRLHDSAIRLFDRATRIMRRGL
jgi:aminoglycoside phosphotransferase (APT) family kinase protein